MRSQFGLRHRHLFLDFASAFAPRIPAAVVDVVGLTRIHHSEAAVVADDDVVVDSSAENHYYFRHRYCTCCYCSHPEIVVVVAVDWGRRR